MRDEINVRMETPRGTAIPVRSGPCGFYIIGEEFSEGPCAEAALQFGVVGGKYMP